MGWVFRSRCCRIAHDVWVILGARSVVAAGLDGARSVCLGRAGVAGGVDVAEEGGDDCVSTRRRRWPLLDLTTHWYGPRGPGYRPSR